MSSKVLWLCVLGTQSWAGSSEHRQMHQVWPPPSVSNSEDMERVKSEAEACVGLKEQALVSLWASVVIDLRVAGRMVSV